ncbi:hypothetical protein [Dictyobacter arantiisoli]|uniref:Uncharacterized protein n=1 Tax=Dictyobacter arantiisoli TaxID=2014874 RepID=A0A5A5T905_9CHLR|nr:hypothetical protein [Dictyobacter arantiisoli]GCF07882.1 hypothetical protein KDI_14460 [Dictyobacter arantiisoli]
MINNHTFFVAVTRGAQGYRDSVFHAMPAAMLEKNFCGSDGFRTALLRPVASGISVPISWGRPPDIIYR